MGISKYSKRVEVKAKRKLRQKPIFRLLDAEIEVLDRKYVWFKRGENRFRYFAGNSYLHSGMFDAFDEGYSSFSKYVNDAKIREKEAALNRKYAAARDAKYTKVRRVVIENAGRQEA